MCLVWWWLKLQNFSPPQYPEKWFSYILWLLRCLWYNSVLNWHDALKYFTLLTAVNCVQPIVRSITKLPNVLWMNLMHLWSSLLHCCGSIHNMSTSKPSLFYYVCSLELVCLMWPKIRYVKFSDCIFRKISDIPLEWNEWLVSKN